MSYQPFPPGAGQPAQPGGPAPTVQQPGVAFGAPLEPSGGGRRPGLIGAGALVMIAGVAGGLAMVMASSSNYDDGVTKLARAPIGCSTTLEFDEVGTFMVYVETTGQIGRRRGDCPASDADYDFAGDGLPNVDVELIDDNGDSVDLDDDESASYTAAGFEGRSIASFTIETAGEFVVTVTTDDEDFAIAIGKNPKDKADSLRTKGLAVIAAGVVLGGVLLFLGLRRPTKTEAEPPPGMSAGPQPLPPGFASPPAPLPTQQFPPQAPPRAPPPVPPADGPRWAPPPS